MEKNEPIVTWLNELQVRLNKFDNRLRKEQTLNELLTKITKLMKEGNFKDAAYLRQQFDLVRNSQ